MRRIKHESDSWLGDEAYVVPPLDGKGYLEIPDELHEMLTEDERLAGIRIGWIARPQPIDFQKQIPVEATASFLNKLTTVLNHKLA